MLPEWNIYKNDQKIGQTITWHKGLDLLIRSQLMSHFKVEKYGQFYLIIPIGCEEINRYKIVKER